VLAPVDEPAASAPAEPSAPTPAPARPAPRTPPRDNGRTTTPQKPAEPLPETPLPQTMPADPAPTPPAPTLRAPGPNNAEKVIRDRLNVAQRDLARVDYGKLSQDGRAQYEQSKRFAQQAEQAIKDQNFVFATTLADKAATLAAELLGR
jgi:hypothetical protein